jgi:hypothetical protein
VDHAKLNVFPLLKKRNAAELEAIKKGLPSWVVCGFISRPDAGVMRIDSQRTTASTGIAPVQHLRK